MNLGADAPNPDRNALRVGWFTTANGPGSRGMFEAVLGAIQTGELNASIEFVFVNRERGQTAPTDNFLDLVESQGIPLVTLSSRRYRRERGYAPWSDLRSDFDRAVLAKIDRYNPDVSVMAGYMLFAPEISREMLILNQHPALPGGTIGRWQDAIWEVIESRTETHGSMIHIATPELDRGPVATVCSFSVRGAIFDTLWDDADKADITALRRASDETLPLFRAVREEGVKRERPLVVETLKAVVANEIDLEAVARGATHIPLDLTERVESAITR